MASWQQLMSLGLQQRAGLALRQRDDPTLLPIIDYYVSGKLPFGDELARTVTLTRSQYTVLVDILHCVQSDGTLRDIPPSLDRRGIFEEAHTSTFAGHHLRRCPRKIEEVTPDIGCPNDQRPYRWACTHVHLNKC